MAKKATLTDVTDTANNASAINTNINAVNDKLDNTLSLDGSTPNAMNADIDLNGNDVLNGGSVHTANLFLGGDRLSASSSVVISSIAAKKEYETVSTMLAETDDYTTFASGDYLRVLDGNLVYIVAESGATDHHLTTNGGVKLYAVPDKTGAISTAQLGWVADQDVSSLLTSFMAARQTGISGLTFTATYRLQGSGYTLPTTLKRFEAVDQASLSHGEEATIGFEFMDANPQTAAVFGLSVDTSHTFNTPSGFICRGMRFGDASAVDTSLLVSGGNRGEVFHCEDNAKGFHIEKCRFDTNGGVGLEVINSPNWKVLACHMGRQKQFLNVKEAADFGEFTDNYGEMGYIARNAADTNTQIFGDYLKTTAIGNRGPRYCRVARNYFLNKFRDGPDGTGGFGGWVFEQNVFDVAVAAIDIKQSYRAPSDLTQQAEFYAGIVIRDNKFIGCGLVYTSTWDEPDVGEPFDRDAQIRNIVCDGNVFVAKVGKRTYAHYAKSLVGGLTCTNEQFIAIRTDSAGDWDASTGSFPASSVYGTHYRVSVAGTVDGESFDVDDFLRPLQDDASTSTFEGQWDSSNLSTEWIGMFPIKMDGTGYTGDTDAGDWDASAGTFPASSSVGSHYTVTVAGEVDNMLFEVGDVLFPLVDDASTTDYDFNWKKRPSDAVVPSKISMSNIRWDSRGAAGWDLRNSHDCDFHFDEWITDGTTTVTLGGQRNHISGKISGIRKPVLVGGVLDVITVKDCVDCSVNVDFSLDASGGRGGLLRVTGLVKNFKLDGRVENMTEVVDLSGSGEAENWRVGYNGGLDLVNVTRFMSVSGTVSGVQWGVVELNGAAAFSGSPGSDHNMVNLYDWRGNL